MAAVRGKDTAPEMKVRRLLHGMGYRYRVHPRDLPGRPDLFFSRRRKAIFVNGCFWHGHRKCDRASLPSSNSEFWKKKIETNVARDARNLRMLQEQGIRCLVVWQCEMKDVDQLEHRLTCFLGEPKNG